MDLNKNTSPSKTNDNLETEKNSPKRKRIEISSSEDENNEIEWVEEDSESDEELECEIWDNDCITIRNEKRNYSIIGYNVGKGLQQAENYSKQSQPSKQLKILLNDTITNENLKKSFYESWNNNKDFKTENVDLTNEPFKFCYIDNFFENTSTLDNVRYAFNDIQWNKRKMDLYEFFQSQDLKHEQNTVINKIYEFLKNDVQKWMCDITGMDLVNISATCSFYSNTDFLLVHDDLQEDRAIAFVLYMTDPKINCKEELWNSEMGGALELFGSDENGQPTVAAKKILPKNNRFIFFKVTNKSFHQVEEVLSINHCRYSINGWFHTKNPNPLLSTKTELLLKNYPDIKFLSPLETEIKLENWIDINYLKKSTRREIQKQIEETSEISLKDFFTHEKFEDLYTALQNNDICWEKSGPPNRKQYEVILSANVPEIVSDLLKLFQSKYLFALLKDYTELDLIEQKNAKPSVKIEIQRWSPGNYSLISDNETPELDVMVYIGCDKNIVGGETMYIANDKNIEDALMTIEPADNTLNIVFRDTAKFTRYFSKKSQIEYFYTLVCTYRE